MRWLPKGHPPGDALTASNNPQVRLQKAIAAAGLASRRGAERMIEAGQVRVNGEVVSRLGTRVDPGSDVVEVNGRRLASGSGFAREVWALYKPRRCVTTLHDPQGRRTVRDYFPRTRWRLFPVGRLDYDTEGLILLTNDGDFAQRVTHPSYSVAKTYLVKVKGIVDPVSLRRMAAAPLVDGKRRRPLRARLLHSVNDKTWCELVLREGVNREIKKLFEDMGHRVIKLKRYQIGTVALETLRPGESRLLGQREIDHLLGESS